MKKKRLFMITFAFLLIASFFLPPLLPASASCQAGSIEVQAKSKKSSEISKKKAKSIAKSNAKKNYNIKTSTIKDLEADKDKYKGKKVWEVSFEAKIKGKKGYYEFEYQIQRSNGKVLHREKERD